MPLQFALAVELAAAPPWTRLRAFLAPVAAVALCFALAAQIGSVVPQSWLPVTTAHPSRWPDYRWVADRVPVGAVVLTDASVPIHVLPAYGLYLVAPTWPDPSTPAADRDPPLVRHHRVLLPLHPPPPPHRHRPATTPPPGSSSLRALPPTPATLTATSPRTGERLFHLAP